MNKKKSIIIILMIVLPLLGINSNAEPLIEISKGDNWLYNIQYNTNSNYKATESNEIVVFNVTDIDYLPALDNEDEEMKVNKIESNKTIDEYKVYEFNSKIIDMKEQSGKDATLQMKINFYNPIDDQIYKSSRGNILYKRMTNFSLNISFIDIIYNGNRINDTIISLTNVNVIEECSNPSIVETIATGTVQTNKRTFVLNPYDDYYIDNGIINDGSMKVITFKLSIEERYEASNEFILNDVRCRNITITTTDMYIEEITFGSFSEGDYGVPIEYWSVGYLPIDFISFKEIWTYTYEIGLPLSIEKTLSTPSFNDVKLSTTYKLPKLIMKLIDFDIQNSTYEFETKETPVSLTFGLIGIGILSITLRKRKRNI